MKKISIVAVLAIAAAGFTACGNQGPKANLKTDVDTMSYAIGMAQTQGLKEYLVGSLDVDTAYMAEFIKGLNEGGIAIAIRCSVTVSIPALISGMLSLIFLVK